MSCKNQYTLKAEAPTEQCTFTTTAQENRVKKNKFHCCFVHGVEDVDVHVKPPSRQSSFGLEPGLAPFTH